MRALRTYRDRKGMMESLLRHAGKNSTQEICDTILVMMAIPQGRVDTFYVSHDLNSLKAGFMKDYIGEESRGNLKGMLGV